MRPYPHAAAVAALALGIVRGAVAVPSVAVPSALTLGPDDLRIERHDDAGLHLYVRAKAGLASILLTESTRDPALKADSFAYRALEKNAVNGGEMRILAGRSAPSPNELHFLVDSSLEADPIFGHAFHIFIPPVVAWGYPWSRSGKVLIRDGAFINVRTFAKPYADYSGPFADNPYVVRVSRKPPDSFPSPPVGAPAPGAAVAPPPAPPSVLAPAVLEAPLGPPAPPSPVTAAPFYKEGLYYPETVSAFGKIAEAGRGELRFASTDRDILSQIDALLETQKGRSLDLVLCLDTTGSMVKALDVLKDGLPDLLSKRTADFTSFRLGLVAFKDYFEEYLYKRFDFTRDTAAFSSRLDSLQGGGGRDVSEAVFEGLLAAASEFPWAAQSRLVLLVGNAPPHPLPRGSVDESEVYEAAAASGLVMDAVAVPK